jgi:nucleotidyltransferase substrate binding protein (TIGR01987 family)
MPKPELENFEKTLAQLTSFLSEPVVTDRDRAGVIQAFEFTFEQSWKAIQKIAGHSGVVVGTPKQAYAAAVRAGWIPIEQEPSWIRLIDDRNRTSHTYKEQLAQEVLARIQGQYRSMFEALLGALDRA